MIIDFSHTYTKLTADDDDRSQWAGIAMAGDRPLKGDADGNHRALGHDAMR